MEIALRGSASLVLASILALSSPVALAETPSSSAEAPVPVSASHRLFTWIRSRQSQKTGLIPSYEGDPALKNVAFTYDQALSVLAFTLMKDFEAARRVLEFFQRKAPRSDGWFMSAYDTVTGDAWEYRLHAGPNAWLGLAALQYGLASGDLTFKPLAASVADKLAEFQEADPEFGVRGGPEESWFSTEHNLDAYAFFSMMYELTADVKYRIAQERALTWLSVHVWEIDRHNGRVLRGKDDAFGASDVFFWTVAAVGPQRLADAGMEPDRVMDFAEKTFQVNVSMTPPGGAEVSVTGFDFAEAESHGREKMVSAEWTAQAAVSYQLLARYFAPANADKARLYHGKALFYLKELDKLVVLDPGGAEARAFLPYATRPETDTGHGWKTPAGDRTGSVAATAYTLFAAKGFNPFEIQAD